MTSVIDNVDEKPIGKDVLGPETDRTSDASAAAQEERNSQLLTGRRLATVFVYVLITMRYGLTGGLIL